MDIFADDEFVEWKDFVESLDRIYQHKSSLVIKAELEKLEMKSLKFREICGPRKRFPDDGAYVNISFGFYADVLSRLPTSRADDQFWKRELRDILQRELRYKSSYLREFDKDMFNRAKFEREYNLRWSEGTRWMRIIFLVAVFLLLCTMIASAEN